MRNIDIDIETTTTGAKAPSSVEEPIKEEKEKRKIVKGAKEGINAVRLSLKDSDILDFMADKGAFSTYIKKLLRREIELQAQGRSIFDEVETVATPMAVTPSVDQHQLNGMDNKLDLILAMLREQERLSLAQTIQEEPFLEMSDNEYDLGAELTVEEPQEIVYKGENVTNFSASAGASVLSLLGNQLG